MLTKFVRKKSVWFQGVSLAFIFFVFAFVTLKDYGPSWDETIHFRRGQAYLHYFLTGKLSYDLPTYDLQGTKGDPSIVPYPRRSFYQNDKQNGEYFLKIDVGHPPLNGELAALSNYIFYQKLGILDDVSSHHIFNIFSSSLLVFIVFVFMARTFGDMPALVSVLSLVTYPLFWSESHFNIKDPAVSAFYALTAWSFYEYVNSGRFRWYLLLILGFVLSLGVKFNILFSPFILIPYFVYRYAKYFKRPLLSIKRLEKKYLFLFFVSPFLISVLFLLTWPSLWNDFPSSLLKIFSYYLEIGSGTRYQTDTFYIFGFNIYPLAWTIFTTPPLVLSLVLLGIFATFKYRKLFSSVSILWLLWLVTPFLRVSFPGASIYGGVRQVMEFLPAMVLLAGLGAYSLFEYLGHRRFIWALITFAFVWPILTLIKLHPYENVYFNFLIGGLSGAKENGIPSWGNSLGNAYMDGISWINKNVEFGAKLALIQGTPSNAPPIFMRADIDYLVNGDVDSQETYFSGINREGEYLMELTGDIGRDFYYAWEYTENFLEPVYEFKVDDVSLLKIWKNDIEHTREILNLKETLYEKKIKSIFESNSLTLDLVELVVLSRIKLTFDIDSCLLEGFVETSVDGESWNREKDSFPQLQLYKKSNVDGNILNYYFAGREARFVRFNFGDNCEFIIQDLDVYYLR